jgi:hypothetical protein
MPLILDGNGDITGLVAGALPSTVIGAGGILQVVSGVRSTETSTVSASLVTTNLTASITPSSSSNKILINVSLGDCSATNSGSGGIRLQLQRNGSAVGANFNNQLSYQDPASLSIGAGGFLYLDSPASTSSLTYTVFFLAQNGTVAVFRDNTQGSIVLMEIAA